jgi:predicted nucleic acid-binding protein
MATNKKPKYCWDTNTLLAWLTEEEGAPLAEISLVVKEIDDNEATLVIPVPVFSEVFQSRLSTGQKYTLDRFRQRSNVVLMDLTLPISTEAAEIRERGHAEKPKRKLKTLDAQIAATAIAAGVDELHALDRDLLNLDGHPTVKGLRIKSPGVSSGQKGLFG